MAFDSSFDDKLGVLGDNTLVIGTLMLGTDFGQIKTAKVTRDADKEEIEAAGGNLRAVVLKKIRFELDMEVIFDTSVDPPGLLDSVTLPFAGVTGRVLGPIEIKWEEGKERILTFKATSWDALEDAVAYSYNPSTGVFTSLDA